MPALIPTETDRDVLTLKAQGAQAIVAELKAFLKIQNKTVADQKQLSACIDVLYAFAKALETPYPSNIYSAGFSYAWDPKKYTEAGARAVHSITTETIPNIISTIQPLVLTGSVQQFVSTVLKYLMAIQLGEEEKQNAISRGEAGMFDKMAYDVLQEQEPKMDFRRVSNLLIKPLIEALREKLLSDQQQMREVCSPAGSTLSH